MACALLPPVAPSRTRQKPELPQTFRPELKPARRYRLPENPGRRRKATPLLGFINQAFNVERAQARQ
jgi:hypothetical protein